MAVQLRILMLVILFCFGESFMTLFKKFTSRGLTATFALALSAWSSSSLAQDYVSVFSYDGQKNETSVSVPVNPERVVVADYAVLDIMDKLELDDKITGLPTTGAMPTYLQKFQKDSDYTNVGTVKELDLEKLMELNPEVIFIGGRLAAKYDELSQIAPVVLLAVDYQHSLMDSVKRNTNTIATIFDKEELAKDLIADFDERITNLKHKAQGKSVVVGMVNANQFKTLGNSGRCSMIGLDIGFNNLAKDIAATHGNEASFELLLKLNPEYVFILDRDSAIGRSGAQLAKDVMNNEIVHKTKAYQENKITYLNSGVWYLSEGGITATDLMLKDIEQALD